MGVHDTRTVVVIKEVVIRMTKKYQLTDEGLSELKKELNELKSRRQEITQKIKQAREYGDLSENAEYHAAREEQGIVESRIAEIESILSNADVVKNGRKKDTVDIGSQVTLNADDSSMKVTIVSSFEADPAENKISDESPMGRSLIGKKVGESVKIKTPAGEKVYTIKVIN